ncbi:YfiR family protein [Nisaea sp.]|uniref:YfiR family protein n=1 Tax=Nisaea sp. TaxID=2024842 RepID=UPI003B526F68
MHFADATRVAKAALSLLGLSMLALGLTCSHVRGAPGDSATVAAVKAAFVFNFAKFTDWPENRMRSGDADIVFCVQRNDLDHRVVKDLERKSINDRMVAIRILGPGADIMECHLFFFSNGMHGAEFDGLVARAAASNVLLISDMPDFAERGGHIALITDQNRLRFKINLGAATGSGLKLSSKLLQLAEIVATENQ